MHACIIMHHALSCIIMHHGLSCIIMHYHAPCIYTTSPRYNANLSLSCMDKMDFWAFLCFSFKYSPSFFFHFYCFFIHCTVSGTFLHIFITNKDYFVIAMIKVNLIAFSSCKTSYNVLSQGSWVNLWAGGWGWWGCWHSGRRGVVENRESPVFRSPWFVSLLVS